jgi:hypothetical protein
MSFNREEAQRKLRERSAAASKEEDKRRVAYEMLKHELKREKLLKAYSRKTAHIPRDEVEIETNLVRRELHEHNTIPGNEPIPVPFKQKVDDRDGEPKLNLGDEPKKTGIFAGVGGDDGDKAYRGLYLKRRALVDPVLADRPELESRATQKRIWFGKKDKRPGRGDPDREKSGAYKTNDLARWHNMFDQAGLGGENSL